MRSRSITSVVLAGPRVQTILALRRTGPGEGKISEAAMSNVSKDLIPCYQLCVAGDQLRESTQHSAISTQHSVLKTSLAPPRVAAIATRGPTPSRAWERLTR